MRSTSKFWVCGLPAEMLTICSEDNAESGGNVARIVWRASIWVGWQGHGGPRRMGRSHAGPDDALEEPNRRGEGKQSAGEGR